MDLFDLSEQRTARKKVDSQHLTSQLQLYLHSQQQQKRVLQENCSLQIESNIWHQQSPVGPWITQSFFCKGQKRCIYTTKFQASVILIAQMKRMTTKLRLLLRFNAVENQENK